jgi:pilus assembly protein Flp/PilA
MLKQYANFQVWLATHKNGKSKGQSLAEYGLILAFIAVACIAALTSIGGSISTMLEGLSTTIEGVNTTGR